MKRGKKRKLSIKAVKRVRYQVKQALVKRAEVKNFKPTVAQAQSWFNILNRGLFSSRLTLPEIRLKKLKDCYGQCLCLWDARKVKSTSERTIPVDKLPNPEIEFRIELLQKYETWKMFIETLGHEMVHLYQMTIDRDIYSNHNANFYRWRNKFKQVGLKLSF
jgi:hypothetical protein